MWQSALSCVRAEGRTQRMMRARRQPYNQQPASGLSAPLRLIGDDTEAALPSQDAYSTTCKNPPGVLKQRCSEVFIVMGSPGATLSGSAIDCWLYS